MGSVDAGAAGTVAASEDDVRAALFEVRTCRRRPAARSWPQAWFGAGESHHTDTAARVRRCFDEGFQPPRLIICDTCPPVAAAPAKDDHHACVELLPDSHLAGREPLVPGTVVAEVRPCPMVDAFRFHGAQSDD